VKLFNVFLGKIGIASDFDVAKAVVWQKGKAQE
jgi:hypothetical protein